MYNFWEKSGWESEDKHLSALKEGPFCRSFPKLPLGPGLYVIRGPRQVGKSSWLKTILAQVESKKSFYLSCENIEDYKELNEVLKSIQDRTIILLDEISFVKQWWRAIKHRLDSDKHVCFIVTGSHSFEIKQGMDQMPGRWGNGGEFELLPMDIFEFIDMRKMANWSSKGFIADLEMYFKIGGFPAALIEAGEHGTTPIKAMNTYRHWIMGDLLKAGKQEQFIREILGQLAITHGSTLSLQKVAQRTQLGSHNTAQNYIELLESCFALQTLYALDSNTGAPRFRKEKKFYFRDPLIYWLALDWANQAVPLNHLSQLAEMVAHEHLFRRYKKIGYYTDTKGEIDFYSHKLWAIEVKWQDIPQGLSPTYRKLLCQQKIIWSKNNFLREWPRNNTFISS